MVSIQFVGLMLLVNLTNTGAQVIGGQLPGHQLFIAYTRGSLVSQTQWPVAGTFTTGGITYDFVVVTSDNITFGGSTDTFVNQVGILPHLSCCCSTMTGILPAYSQPNQSSAIYNISNGVLITS